MPSLDELVGTLRDEAGDVCTGAELMARMHRPRRLRTTFIAVAAGIAAAVVVTVVLAARHGSTREPVASSGPPTASQSSAGPATVRIVLHSEVPASITIPSGWSHTRAAGPPATIAFPLAYISNQQMPPQCTGVVRASCWTSLAFPGSWRTPRDGVLIEWLEYENPTLSGHPLKYVPGRRTTINHLPARISRAAPNGQNCPIGTSSQLIAFVDVPGSGALRFDMTACFGRRASQEVRSDVVGMLYSLATSS